MNEKNKRKFGIPDEKFVRGKVPMTKEEVRVITLSKLELDDQSIVVDIGAGTGSISIECALIAEHGKVYSVEVNNEGIELINRNIQKFEVENVYPIMGMAPEALEKIESVDRIMIGGSKGNLKEIVSWADENLNPEGIIVANFITIENTYLLIEELKKNNYTYELVQISVSKSKLINNITMMQGLNPVFIVSAKKNNKTY